MTLTPGEERVYRYIIKYKSENNGNSPSYRDIAENASVALCYVKKILRNLEEKGFIVLKANQAKGIEVVNSDWKMNDET